MDKETIVAGILHDAVEDTIMTRDDIEREFGAEVALLVEGSQDHRTLPADSTSAPDRPVLS